MAEAAPTIIIKKIKKGGEAPHGGAWKVAYADFVTAMMAFFLLMWLLNATEAEQLAGLADYFAPTLGVQGALGIGFRGGKGALSKGIGADKNTNKGIVFGGVPTGPIMKVTEKIELIESDDEGEKAMLIVGEGEDQKKIDKEEEKVEAKEIGEGLEEYINEIAQETGTQELVNVGYTPEIPDGLHIQIKDSENSSMFVEGTAELTPSIKKALNKLGEIIGHLLNRISIIGHTSAVSLNREDGYSNWELSSDRAHAVRRVLVKSGVQSEQIAKVVGKSDNEPIDTIDPFSPINNRVSIVLLRDDVLAQHKKAAPEEIFIDVGFEEKVEEVIEEEEPSNDEKPVKTFIIEEMEPAKEAEKIESADPFLGENGSAPAEVLVDEAPLDEKDSKPLNKGIFKFEQ